MSEQLEKTCEKVLNLNPNNDAIKYVVKRLQHNKYRGGAQGPQHNNMSEKDVHHVMKCLSNHTQINNLEIPKGDDEGERFPPVYESFWNDIREKRSFSDNSFRKNYIPTLIRGGFIERTYADNKAYINIKNFGIEYLNSSNEISRQEKYYQFLLKLFPIFAETIEKILRENNEIDEITFLEFMFFVRGMIGQEKPDLYLPYENGVELIKNFKDIRPAQLDRLENILKEGLDRKHYKNEKKGQAKRDWGNWVNYINQHFLMFKDSNFVITKKGKTNDSQVISLASIEKSKLDESRNKKAKEEWFKNHNQQSTEGFHLDHIVPRRLRYGRSEQYAKSIDDWRNLVLLNAYFHDIKNRKNSQHMVLKKGEGNNLIYEFIDGSEKPIELNFKEDVIYDPKYLDEMLNHNKKLIDAY